MSSRLVRAGKRLKQLRVRLGLSTRDVELRSKRIAQERRSQEFYLSHSWVIDIESGEFQPSWFKLYCLACVYGCPFTEILSYFEMPLWTSEPGQNAGFPKTHLLASGFTTDTSTIELPVEVKPPSELERTNLLAHMVETWQQVPVGLLKHLDLRKSMYGYIGLKDFTLYPLIRPGSLVQIDTTQRKVSPEKWRTEFERPIYFVELHGGYLCSWCQLDRGQLMVIPHPYSLQNVRRFDYPSQAEIVGRVTGIVMRITGENLPKM